MCAMFVCVLLWLIKYAADNGQNGLGDFLGVDFKDAAVLWEKLKPFLVFDRNRPKLNACYCFVQFFYCYHLCILVLSELDSGFCAFRMVVSCMYYDVFTAIPVASEESTSVHSGWMAVAHNTQC
jgi:hypothetical protein